MANVTPLSDAEMRMLEAVQDYMYIELHCWNCEVCKQKGDPNPENEPCKTCISARMPFSRLVAALRDRDRKLAILRAHRLDPDYLWAQTRGLLNELDPVDKTWTPEQRRREVDRLIAFARGEQDNPDAH